MPLIIQLLICCLIGLLAAFGVIALTLRFTDRFKFGRRAEEFHHGNRVSIPRLGGIGLAAAYVAVKLAAPLLFGSQWTLDHEAIFLTALAMFGLGLWDDLRGLGARRKLCGQLLIATAAYFMGLGIVTLKIPLSSHVIDLGLWAWPVTVLWIVGMTNLINLIDGVDGLAGGICLMLMLLLAVEGGTGNDISFVATGMAGALLAFLRFNFPPARIYMGDGGAYFLGCLIGLLTIASSQKGTVAAALTAPLLVLALPILDTSLAIARRGLQGLPLFRADRQHIHHRLLDSGLSRKKLVLGAYAFTAFFLALGVINFWWRGQFFPLTIGAGILAVLLMAGRLNFSREWFAVERVLGNSLSRRSEVKYALAQTRWLEMEGERADNLVEICGDTAFIARKLGFVSMRVRLEDDERTWRLDSADGTNECRFQHELPGHHHCFIELTAICPSSGDTCFLRHKNLLKNGARRPNNHTAGIPGEISAQTASALKEDLNILSELIAEGWVKAILAWKKTHQLPSFRFDAPASHDPKPAGLEIIPPIHTMTVD